MSLLSRLFGGKRESAEPESAVIDYEGFRVIPEPMKEGSVWRLCARIEKEIDGETKSHRVIRADTLQGRDQAVEVSINKAKQMIDEQGDALFH